ncbi:MAG: PH domain-containing protein [Phycisphaerae bacterium]|nr:PH domain-containing protein [Phycisphaerae bacterium]
MTIPTPRSASQWVYHGVWAVLTDLFLVPREPPNLPTISGESPRAVRPCEGWLTYRKVVFWVLCLIIDVALFVPWAVLFAEKRTLALWLALPWLLVMVVPDILAYVAVHLRYDTTWYVLSDRSMRLRRGVWSIHESTITFDNIQNVKITQGPIQRWLGFSDLEVQTAGGGSGGPHAHGSSSSHLGILEGIEDPTQLRELIMDKVRASRSAGLGDERHTDHHPSATSARWTPAHLEALRQIAAATAALRAG